MSIAEGMFSVICDKCRTTHDFPAEEADFDCTGGDQDRQMGPENIYTWEMEFNCECGQLIEIDYQAVEYPVGAYNFDDVTVNGASPQGGYTFSFHEEEEPYDD